MKRYFVYSLPAAGLMLLTAAGYGQLAHPITSLPFNISESGKYVLERDLKLSSNVDAITVNASFVRLDLNGFSIANEAITGGQKSATGIKADGFSNVEIRNGEIRGFSTGIEISKGSGHVVENLRILDNDINGLTLNDCTDSVIRTCEILRDAPSPILGAAGIDLQGGSGNRVVNNAIAGVVPDALYSFGIHSQPGANGGNYCENDYIASCITGISMAGLDKYRSITTTNCTTPIVGGLDVDGTSK
jgi:parallel beta helix pectate lyase-like protein